MSQAIDQALTNLLATYAKVEPVVQLVKASATPRPLVEKAPSDNGAKVTIVRLPLMVKGDLDAKGFMTALRRATNREQAINAIAGYIGYDPNGEYGTQELRARMTAQKEMHPMAAGPSRSERRSALATVKGYVSGLPNGMNRKIGDLMAREEMAAEARDAHFKAASGAGCHNHDGDGSCCMHHAMAEVETVRMSHIRQDLDKLR